jgi:hypothetical protein
MLLHLARHRAWDGGRMDETDVLAFIEASVDEPLPTTSDKALDLPKRVYDGWPSRS